MRLKPLRPNESGIGQKIGEWTATHEISPAHNGRRRWLWTCPSGEHQRKTDRPAIKNYPTCVKCQSNRDVDPLLSPGDVIGDFTAVTRVKRGQYRSSDIWLWTCPEGHVRHTVRGNVVHHPNCFPCKGRKLAEKPNRASLDIAGKRYGMVTGVRFSHYDKHRLQHWVFLCSCGKEFTAPKNRVTRYKRKSCGCTRAPSHIKGVL